LEKWRLLGYLRKKIWKTYTMLPHPLKLK
jgi:hypothetical protein